MNHQISSGYCIVNGEKKDFKIMQDFSGNVYYEDVEKMKVKLDEGAIMPTRAHEADAGLDLYSPIRKFIMMRDSAVIDTGVHVEIPRGYVGMIKSKSGLNVNHGLSTEGVIDSGYTGSIKVKIINHSEHPYVVEKGDKITQLVILPILTPELELVESLDDTERGENGFGSTGK